MVVSSSPRLHRPSHWRSWIVNNNRYRTPNKTLFHSRIGLDGLYVEMCTEIRRQSYREQHRQHNKYGVVLLRLGVSV